ncbi:MAG TPA: hypothetical protein VK034_18910 [Enhygromyxa sp.]|nr:hypothetical protein [Enhygromyxa sp.]
MTRGWAWLAISLLAGGCAGRRIVATIDLPPARMVSVGGWHGCAVTHDGQTHCWGDLWWHHVDDRVGSFSGRPTRVAVADEATAIEVGYESACAATPDGIVCWWHDPGRKPDSAWVWRRAVAARTLSSSGTALCWIDTNGRASCEGIFPWRTPGILTSSQRAWDCYAPRSLARVGPVISLSLTTADGCVTSSDGRVRCWGLDHDGGRWGGDPPFAHEGQLVEVANVDGAVEVAVAPHHACARLDDGGVTCWGAELPPTRVAGVEGAQRVKVTERRSCALVDGGQVLCWGPATAPRPVRGLDEIVDFDLAEHLCAVRADGAIVCVYQGVISARVRAAVGDARADDSDAVSSRPRPAVSGPWSWKPGEQVCFE